MESGDLCTKYLKLAEAKTNSVLPDAKEEINLFDPYAGKDKYEKARDKLQRISQNIRGLIGERNFSLMGE